MSEQLNRHPEDRKAVYDYVQKEAGFTGSRPTDASAFLGDWTYRFHTKAEPFIHVTFFEDGRAPGKAVDGSFEKPDDRWKLNPDGSFSEWCFVEAMPEYGLEEAGHCEELFHVLFKDADTFVLFNDDGSLIRVYERTGT